MQQYTIPRTGIEVSRIAYGCMALGGDWGSSPPGAVIKKRAEELVETALAAGITLFDHADIYCRGKSELVFGQVLRQQPGLRGKISLQSKCGIRFADDPQPGSPGRYDFSYAHLIGSVEGILHRLGTDYLDILLLHRPDSLAEPEEVARAFSELQQAGKVRHFGVSNHSGAQIALLQQTLDQPLVVNQVELNLLHHQLINDGVMINQNGLPYSPVSGTLDHCRRHGILLQAWAPVAGGKLSGSTEDTAPEHRAVAALAAQMAQEKHTSLEAILLAWLLRHPAGIQPVIGTSRPERLTASCQADTLELSREEWYRLFIAARGSTLP